MNFAAETLLQGYVAVWCRDQVNGHYLWFYPIERVFNGVINYLLADTSGYTHGPQGLIATARGTFTGQGLSVGIATKEFPLPSTAAPKDFKALATHTIPSPVPLAGVAAAVKAGPGKKTLRCRSVARKRTMKVRPALPSWPRLPQPDHMLRGPRRQVAPQSVITRLNAHPTVRDRQEGQPCSGCKLSRGGDTLRCPTGALPGSFRSPTNHQLSRLAPAAAALERVRKRSGGQPRFCLNVRVKDLTLPNPAAIPTL